MVLANNPKKKEESLKPGHGLETIDWRNTLAGGIRSVLDLRIRATDGTFCELMDVCWHLNTLHLFDGPTNSVVSTGQPLGQVRFATDGSQLTLEDLVSRLYQTGLAYPDLTGKRPKMYHGARIASHRPGVHLAFPLLGIPDELKRLADRPNVHVGSSNQIAPGLRQADDAGDCLIFVRGQSAADLADFPVSHYGGTGGFMVVMLDFPNGDKLTEFVKLYLVSYILGMLVRYYPSIWTALLRNEKGDFAQPLLVDAIEAVEDNFAEQLSHQMTGTVRKVY